MNLGNAFRFLNSRELQSFRIKVHDAAAPTIFMHMLKTSGTALTRGLAAALMSRRAVYGIGRVLFGDFEAFDGIEPELRRAIYLDPSELPPNADFVTGHISYSTLLQRYESAQYITVLREPVSRIVSHWLYWRTRSDDQIQPWGARAERVYKSRASLINFLSSQEVAWQVDNHYVRMLLWPHRLIPDNDFIATRNDETLVREAIARLKRFGFVDLVENPSLHAILQTWLGRPFTYSRANETPLVPKLLKLLLHQELKPEVFDLLEMRARLDLKLWMALARKCVPDLDAESLRARTVMLNAARHSSLMIT